MKKIITVLLIIFQCFTVNSVFAAGDFFINSSPLADKSKIIKPISDFKSNVFKKKNKNEEKKFNPVTNRYEEPPKGYYGTLPNIEADFEYKRKTTSRSSKNNGMQVIDEDEIDESNFKEAPFNDTLFLDNVVKKPKTSNYVNDLKRVRFALLELKKCMEQNGEIQRFNACVNMLDMYVQNLKTKYENQSDSLRESYVDILSTNYYAKVLGNLKYDSNYYSQYIPTQEGKYSKNNIRSEEMKLLNRVNKSIFLIYQEE